MAETKQVQTMNPHEKNKEPDIPLHWSPAPSDEGLYHSNMNTTREAFDIPRLSSVITQTLTLEHTIKNYHLSGYTLKFVFCFFARKWTLFSGKKQYP